jgi:aspartyl protease family protein
MTRPLFWALGVAFGASLAALSSSQRMQSALGFKRGGQAQVATMTPASPSNAGRTLTLQADLRGHYIAHASVNGAVIRTMVDTGASVVALTADDAVKVGAHKSRNVRSAQFNTANGIVTGTIVRLEEIRIGDIVVRDVEAAIMPRGALHITLLGMSFLRGVGGFEISQGRMVIKG